MTTTEGGLKRDTVSIISSTKQPRAFTRFHSRYNKLLGVCRDAMRGFVHTNAEISKMFFPFSDPARDLREYMLTSRQFVDALDVVFPWYKNGNNITYVLSEDTKKFQTTRVVINLLDIYMARDFFLSIYISDKDTSYSGNVVNINSHTKRATPQKKHDLVQPLADAARRSENTFARGFPPCLTYLDELPFYSENAQGIGNV